MYIVYTLILFLLTIILIITLKEEIAVRKGITHGVANKYWVLREKRRFVRFNEDLNIRYNRTGFKASPSHTKIQNISRKGLCLSTYEKLNKKDMLDIEIDIPGFSKSVKFTGYVIWVRELRTKDSQGRRLFYTGIKLGRISPESEAVLITHLNTLRRP